MISDQKRKVLFFVAIAAVFVVLAPISDLAQDDVSEESEPTSATVLERATAPEISTNSPVRAGGVSESEVEVAQSDPPPVEISQPVAENLPPLPFQLPFSLNDCLNLLGAATSTLPERSSGNVEFKPDSYQRLMGAVSNYLERRDDLHFTWVGYDWRVVARRRVTGGLIEQVKVEFDESQMPVGVSALSFSVENADIYLHALRVYGSNATNAEGEIIAEPIIDHQFDEPQILRHSLPREAIFHLLRPNDVGLVDMAVSLVNPEGAKNGRIILKTGKTDKPEHVKSAIWYLNKADEDIAEQNWTLAREHLEIAQEEIRLLRRALRLEK